MLWPEAVKAFLASGGAPNYHVALLVEPVNLTTGLTESVGYWSGHEDLTLNLGGVDHLLFATRGALGMDDPTYSEGTTVRTQRVRMFGLSEQSDDILRAYDVRQKPASAWQLCFSQGGEFKGGRRLLKGFVNGVDQRLGKKGQGAVLELELASSARAGTRTLTAKKSHQSYMQRSGDTAMEYASLTDVDSDWWGPKG